MIALGQYNTLRIVKRVDFGLYLDGGEAGEILMPERYVTDAMLPGTEVEVFLYLDQEERLVATTERPVATVGQFAWLPVAWTNRYGAFLGWGLMKDLFCPFREQKQTMQRDRSYIVYIKEDEESHRLMATAKVERYLQPAPHTLHHGDEVQILVWQKTDLGFKVIVDNRYQGQLYDDQLFQPVTSGQRFTAYIDHVRQDGKIDLTLQPTGQRHALDFAEQLLRYIYEHDGYCPFTDSSSADDIVAEFQVSKKVFKRAVGDLYRRHLIVIDADGLRLTHM